MVLAEPEAWHFSQTLSPEDSRNVSTTTVLGRKSNASSTVSPLLTTTSTAIFEGLGNTEPIVLAESTNFTEKSPRSSKFEFIGYHQSTQHLMNQQNLAWAVMWEVSRLRCSIDPHVSTSEEYQVAFRRLAGPSSMARQVSNVLFGASASSNVSSPYTSDEKLFDELDREEKALREGSTSRLGMEDDAGWHGGRGKDTLLLRCTASSLSPETCVVSQTASIALDKSRIIWTLSPLKLGRSNRAMRAFGSRRLLQVKIAKTLFQKKLIVEGYLRNKFVLNGRIFETIWLKDDSAYLLETGDYRDSICRSSLTNVGRVDLMGFLNWHNPVAFNSNQVREPSSNIYGLSLT